jgi:hypothetical protein
VHKTGMPQNKYAIAIAFPRFSDLMMNRLPRRICHTGMMDENDHV